jgi:hypothetical protein
VNQIQKIEAIVRLLGVTEIRMTSGMHIGLGLSILLGASTSRVLRSWYWYPVWLEIMGKDFRQMWTNCERGDWLLWFCTHMIGQPGWPTHQEIVLTSCQCARMALRHIKHPEKRPLQAIDAAEAWAHGQATLREVQHAGHAADCTIVHGDPAYFAAKAAYSVAWAIYATEDGHSFRRAQAVSGGASWAASADRYELYVSQLGARDFSDAAQAALENIEKKTLCACAEIVRRLIKVPDSLTNEYDILQRKLQIACR